MAKNCYYCGRSPAPKELQISPSFTAGGRVKAPHSDKMCDRCHGIMMGKIQRVWHYNQAENRWVTLYLRGIHLLWQGEKLLYPMLGAEEKHTQTSSKGNIGKPATYRVLSGIPKRLEVREWLLNPPAPPFTIAIAESGQKHILFMAQEGFSRDHFPVQFEEDSLQIDRALFQKHLGNYETLLNAGFSKKEIDTGEYRPDRMLSNFEIWQNHDPIIANYRFGNKPSRYLQLISFVAQKPEYVEQKPKAQPHSPDKPAGQLSLF